MNKLMLTGTVIAKPELRIVGEKTLAKFTIADNYFKTDEVFFRVKAWGKLAEHCEKYLDKGSKVSANISIGTDNYEKETGKKVFGYDFTIIEIEFLSSSPKEA